MTFSGPPALGRSAVTVPGGPVPEPWSALTPVVVDDGVLADPAALREVTDRLHLGWLRREPALVVLACDPAALREPEVEHREPWRLDPSFELTRERLQFLVWQNAWDCRDGDPVWWWARKATRAFPSRVEEGGPADVLVDGVPAWCDGGPRQPLDLGELGGHGVLHRDTIEIGAAPTVATGPPPAPGADLAPDQLAAVAHLVGPARIIAPAGSGKTRVLTERLRHLVADRGWEPGGICAVAYNKRAADEMAERTAGLHLNIRTLNSLGLAICNGTGGFARPAGRGRREVLDEVGVRRILEDLLVVKRQANTDPWVPYLDGLRAIRLGLEAPEAVEAAFDAPGLADAFPRYQRLCEDRGLVDFDGQLYDAIRILLTDPGARTVGQSLARHLLVDEVQDLTPAHLLLLRLLAAPAYDVFGVGDDDQVIYGFGGATPRYLIDFADYFPGAQHHALEVNYRCPPSVVDAATHLLSYNAERIPKAVRPAPGREPVAGELDVRLVDVDEPAAEVLRQLEAWHAGAGVEEYGQMAVLARVNSALLPVQVTLVEAGVPCRTPLDPSILSRTGIRTALAYLRIGLDPGRIARADVLETVRRPSRRIARNVVDMLVKRGHTSVHDIRRLADALSGADVDRLYQYADELQRVVDTVADGDTAQVFAVVRDEVGLGSAMDLLDSSRREADRSTHADDLAALEQVGRLHPDPATFEPWLSEVLRRRSSPGGVEVSTIHRVKGREWDRVVVYGVDAGMLPHRLADDVEEERRLLHVAITRARREAVVLASAAAPSPLLAELDGSRPRQPLRSPRRPPAATLPGAPAGPPASKADPALVEALKAWRLDTARADKVPAYVVLSDKHLEGIAAAVPRSERELARCPGIGPTKLERYGDDILAVIDKATGS